MNEREIKSFFSGELLQWYKQAKRDLPWRRSRDPYHIWVSEIMLQQTRVDTVIPYFNRFMEKFPTIVALAGAPEEDVLKAWEGLGYYSRARNLQAAAREIADKHGGLLPDDKSVVAGLKGIGPYTSGAIMSIAFGRPEPAVDGNVMRVLSRYFCIDEDIARPAVRVGMEGLARELIPEGEASDFNQALMELGALVCTPKSPSCLLCPVMAHCQGRLAGRETELPVKSKAKPPRPEHRLAALIQDAQGRVLVRQRPESGLLARMWELPHVVAPERDAWDSPALGQALLSAALAAEGLAGIRAESLRHLGDAEHVFTHLHWHLRVHGGAAQAAAEAAEWTGAAEAAATEETAAAVEPVITAEKAVAVESAVKAETAIAMESAEVAEGQTAYLPEAAFAGEPRGLPAAQSSNEDQQPGAAPVSDAAPLSDAVLQPNAQLNASDSALPAGYRWIGPAEFERLAWPNVFSKLLGAHFAGKLGPLNAGSEH
ncbi:A/G-specific adenine glycosylase [Cohnella sp. JJ-181]|uniref:A/G-specific adenine glycosylase n=1 Tax=Cohnella rhizoplanae TaxID=2974897 RepID=UPI0022FFB9DB|nr:A/G-specific adenine glycosylase [Cohnella sp. JJ-181]CAI6065265.1 Endonuclease III [Cohnella sp. JJ-181]